MESQAHSSSSSSSSHTPTSPDHPTPSHPHHHRSHKDMPLLHVKLPHVASIVSSVYSNGSVALSHSTSHTLPLQQKLAVATLLLCVRGRAVKEVTLGRLQDVYSRVCSQWQVRQEAQTDFVGLCHVLESRGLLSIKKAKETRLTKVSMFSMAITGVDVYYAHHTCNLYCLMHMIDTLPSLSLSLLPGDSQVTGGRCRPCS